MINYNSFGCTKCPKVLCQSQTPAINVPNAPFKNTQDKLKSMCSCTRAQAKTKPLKGNTSSRILFNSTAEFKQLKTFASKA